MGEVRAVGVAGVFLTLWVAWAAAEQAVPPAPVLAPGSLGPDTAGLEARVSVQPSDTRALLELGDRYLGVGAGGLARAALNRAPAEVLDEPEVADLGVRTWIGLGEMQLALAAQNQLLERCATLAGSAAQADGVQPCSRTLVGVGRARRQRLRAQTGLTPAPLRIARLDLD